MLKISPPPRPRFYLYRPYLTRAPQKTSFYLKYDFLLLFFITCHYVFLLFFIIFLLFLTIFDNFDYFWSFLIIFDLVLIIFGHFWSFLTYL